jgi:hypothetical protein
MKNCHQFLHSHSTLETTFNVKCLFVSNNVRNTNKKTGIQNRVSTSLNERQHDWADSDLHNRQTVREADLPGKWRHPGSPAPVIKCQSTGIKMGNHERLKN